MLVRWAFDVRPSVHSLAVTGPRTLTPSVASFFHLKIDEHNRPQFFESLFHIAGHGADFGGLEEAGDALLELALALCRGLIWRDLARVRRASPARHSAPVNSSEPVEDVMQVNPNFRGHVYLTLTVIMSSAAADPGP